MNRQYLIVIVRQQVRQPMGPVERDTKSDDHLSGEQVGPAYFPEVAAIAHARFAVEEKTTNALGVRISFAATPALRTTRRHIYTSATPSKPKASLGP